MSMTINDLTLNDVLNDPMIAMVLRADRVDPFAFKELLETAARKQVRKTSNRQAPAFLNPAITHQQASFCACM